MRQRGCRNDRRVGDLHVVVQFITFFQTTQNRNGIFNGRLRHEYFLETTFQRGVFLNVLAIFIQRRSAHAVSSPRASAGFSMLPASIAPSALPAPTMVCSSSINRMTLPSCLARSFRTPFKRLQTHRGIWHPPPARPYRAPAPGALSAFRHFTVDDRCASLQQWPFYLHRVHQSAPGCFGTALQNLNRTTNFFIAANHRVKLALLGTFGQIDGKFFQA